MTEPLTGPLVSTDWLAAHLGEPDLRVIDATSYLPHLKRDARAEHREAHVPGAVFFDIDAIADRSTALPHMLPAPEAFASAVSALGIGDGDRVVAYGGRNMIASARAWWMFRVFGHDNVAVLDGGMPKWKAEGRRLDAGEVAPVARRFTARFRREMVRGFDEMRANLDTRREQVVDARSHGRFVGTEPEPRPGLRGGHIPGSLNLPYDQLCSGVGGTMLAPDGIRRVFAAAGLDLGRPAVVT